MRKYVSYNGLQVPEIQGAKGKGGGKVADNTLFSSDTLFLTVGVGEGPVYRINPNGPQDIQIQDGAIEDLINMDTDGSEKSEPGDFKFATAVAYGTTTQSPLPYFGESTVTPQVYANAVSLKKGNLDNIPAAKVDSQETSEYAWDSLRFSFIIDALYKTDSKGNVSARSLNVKITIFKRLTTQVISTAEITFSGKTDKAWKRDIEIIIPENYKDDRGYRFTIEKTSNDTDTVKTGDSISFASWEEVENTPQAYPRTAVVGYALKATAEHTGGVPNFTSMVKGLLVKVPSNYNQPILDNGEIDWRQLEGPLTGAYSYTTRGYKLQKQGTDTVLYEANPQIYVGTWDGSFVYSWTQNPVWIIYDILTNTTYGLGIAEKNIDKYKFYQIAQYCDACNSVTGCFEGVDGLADGSYRYKPRGLFTSVRENQVGLLKSVAVKERRFVTDITISDQAQGLDLLNKLAATIRAALIYAGGKITLAIDMPEEYPVMLFNEANIKEGSFQVSGVKDSDTITGVDVSYIEPTNHFKRETLRINNADANDGTDILDIENIANLDLTGVTRRSQAMRSAQYQIASSKYLRRNITFTTGIEAIYLAPGDVIAVASHGTGIAYGYGGKVFEDSTIGDSSVTLEHYTVPSMTDTVFTANTGPLALRVIKGDSDRLDTYIVSNTAYSLIKTDNVAIGYDNAVLNILGSFNMSTKEFQSITAFSANNVPKRGDLWSLGEILNTQDYYSNKSSKLFKITSIDRASDTEEITINAVEYISAVYEDSDTFIDYEPVAYTDIVSPFAPPPAPNFTLNTRPRVTSDGSVVIDGILSSETAKLGYTQKYETEYYVAYPEQSILVANSYVNSNTMTLIGNTSTLGDTYNTCELIGKNGFSTPAGHIQLLCNLVSTSLGSVTFSLEGLSSCIDVDKGVHVLDSYDSPASISVPLVQSTDAGNPNFIGYSSPISYISSTVTSYDLLNQTITIEDKAGSASTLSTALPPVPFYITLKQVLSPNSGTNFFIKGYETLYVQEGTITPSSINSITLDVKPRSRQCVTLYIDGIAKYIDGTTISLDLDGIDAVLTYKASSSETSYRLEINRYTTPPVEVGDRLEIGYSNVYFVTDSTYDEKATGYNNSLTSNAIYRITLDREPNISLASLYFTNTTENPIGTLGNVSTNSFTFDYNTATYPSTYNLANSRIYSIDVASEYVKYYNPENSIIPNLPLGTTSVKARNRNTLGRVSPFVQKSVIVRPLPIQKVENITITESLYVEQLGGAAVRATCSFDHIVDNEVTDYEISYKLESNINGSAFDIGNSPLKYFNTVKVSATAVDANGRINYTVDNIDRGLTSNEIKIIFKIVPLNRGIRGIEATLAKDIIGKTAKPSNINNFIVGQQNDILTFLWSYEKDSNGNLLDLDLQEVIIKKLTGVHAASYENFLIAEPLVTVSAGSVRKSVPISDYGEFTYLAMTRDTSGNYSENPIAVTLTTVRPNRNTIIAAYSEDNPTVPFTNMVNSNADEYYYPSYANVVTNGIKASGSTEVDNANGSSSGWSELLGTPTDLLATGDAEYVTQIRDLGSVVTGSISIGISGSQQIQSTYYDQHDEFFESAADNNTNPVVLLDTLNGGIGHILGYANSLITTGRYDANNKTWMTGPENGNVWAVWNHGQFAGDTANANTYALIAGLVNANAVALGTSYYANGRSTGSNALANVTTSNGNYTIVNLKQYNDYASSTFAGDFGIVTTKTYIRTAVDSPYYTNGLVNSLAFSSSGEGYVPYEVGKKTFRYLQIKYVVTNTLPDQYDFTLDRFNYTIDKEQITYSNIVSYDNSPTVVDFSAVGFLSRPVISYTVLDYASAEANPIIAITTASSNTSATFKLVATNGTGAYPADGSATVMISAIGV